MPSLALGLPTCEHVWQLFGPDGARADVNHPPRRVTRSMMSLRTAAIAGVGVVQLPTMMVREALDNGSLQRVLPGWAPRREIIHAVFPSRRGLLPSVRGLIDYPALRFGEIAED